MYSHRILGHNIKLIFNYDYAQVPSPPQNFVGEFIHSSSVALFWNAPKYPNGIVLGYYVHVSRRKYNISVENMVWMYKICAIVYLHVHYPSLLI